jgi:hypothetical protein
MRKVHCTTASLILLLLCIIRGTSSSLAHWRDGAAVTILVKMFVPGNAGQLRQ